MTATNMFDLTGRVAVVTGGSGTLGGVMAKGLCEAGARVCVIGRDGEKAEKAARGIGGQDSAIAVAADVTDLVSVEKAADQVLERWGRVDILVNAAGGNRPDATTNPSSSFFDLSPEAIRAAIDLNLMGTLLPSQVFGRVMARAKTGSIINISSMASMRPLTRVVAYSAGKAGMENFTRWLAVYLAREVSPRIRVNAIAPGFFLADQNRAMLVDVATGNLTARGQAIMDHTPMARFGEPGDLVGALLWLASDASAFVTGVVVPVDGGFSSFWGV